MGRGRQKAKQTRIARKLKYLTTDTDYDELAKELSSQDEVTPSAADPFASIETQIHSHDHDDAVSSVNEEDLDEYAQWAAEAAKKAEEKPVVKAPVRRKPIPMPMPSALKKNVKPAAPQSEDAPQDGAAKKSTSKPAVRKPAARKTAARKPSAKAD
ncbi:hypothetical protein CS006_03810 [Bifidobacterium primatium]|uniref:DUF3073 domain-containing protein n=1 Tax=Bifidobacterium primatium TaxID=2045438 RepID=A0A2M9HBT1_9BIFI|nr:hypothetical protein CS006_03810 [Bifidobacterium primatium]